MSLTVAVQTVRHAEGGMKLKIQMLLMMVALAVVSYAAGYFHAATEAAGMVT